MKKITEEITGHDLEVRARIELNHALTRPPFSSYEKEIRWKMMDPSHYADSLKNMYPMISEEEIDIMTKAKDIEIKLHKDQHNRFIDTLVSMEEKKNEKKHSR